MRQGAGRLGEEGLEESHLADGAGTVGTAGCEGLVIVILAIGLSIPLKEGPGTELLPAAGASEVLGVPGPAQRCQHLRGGRRH